MPRARPTSSSWRRTVTHNGNVTCACTGSPFLRMDGYVDLTFSSLSRIHACIQEPVVPAALKHAQEKAIEHSQKAERAKEKLVPKIPETFELRRPEKVQVIQAREKAPLEFKDVGAKFLDVERELQRLKTSQTKRRKRASVAQVVNTAVPPRANLS